MHKDLEDHRDDKDIFINSLITYRLASLKRCKNSVDAIKNNFLHFAQYSRPKPIEVIHGFLSSFDLFVTLFENADLTEEDGVCLDIDFFLNQASDQIFEVVKIEYH